MSRARRYRIVGVLMAWTLSCLVALAACSDQDEGDRCQTQNGNEDCSPGLVCLAAGNVNPPFNKSDRCCPADRRSATHPACALLTATVTGDSAPPPDTGPTPDATPDAAPADGGTDG